MREDASSRISSFQLAFGLGVGICTRLVSGHFQGQASLSISMRLSLSPLNLTLTLNPKSNLAIEVAVKVPKAAFRAVLIHGVQKRVARNVSHPRLFKVLAF